ncbi:MAG: phosphoglycerate kinase [Verrucomicrobiota bacterium]
MAKKSIQNIDVKNKRCLVRVDFNVPMEKGYDTAVISDDTRIRETLPTIQYLIQNDAKIILCSHLGRPKGKPDATQSLKPIAARLSELLGKSVIFASDCIGPDVRAKAMMMKPGDIMLLENLRFHSEEEQNDPGFSRQLASLVEIYVNDAFGAAHRAHASTEGVAHYISGPAVAGFLMQKELQYLGKDLNRPLRPFVVILGGAKVSDKIAVINALLEKANTILIGGAMAYTFNLALGKKIGNSLAEPEKVAVAKATLEKAKERNVKFLLPMDHVVAEHIDFKEKTVSKLKTIKDEIPANMSGVDIGMSTIQAYSEEISQASTIFWNGPMGIFEIGECAAGTFAIAQAVAANRKAKSIIGGGDSVKAVKQSGVEGKITFISTGGGASLEFLEGKILPGVAALNDQ